VPQRFYDVEIDELNEPHVTRHGVSVAESYEVPRNDPMVRRNPEGADGRLPRVWGQRCRPGDRCGVRLRRSIGPPDRRVGGGPMTREHGMSEAEEAEYL